LAARFEHVDPIWIKHSVTIADEPKAEVV